MSKQDKTPNLQTPEPSPQAAGSAIEHCWLCGGVGKRPCHETPQNPTGYVPCHACNGTGYGESLQTYWKRNGVSPNDKTEPQPPTAGVADGRD